MEPRGEAHDGPAPVAARAPEGQRWLFGPRLDLFAFGGSTLAALALVALGSATGALERPLPPWLWLLLVVGVDVAHVHTTWLRTYLDPSALKAHPVRYTLVPLGCYALGLLLHRAGALAFWRGLAYLAVFHFVRQQLGWVALYQRGEPGLTAFDRRLERACVYAATLWPLLYWHTHLPRPFNWFVDGDFVALLPGWFAQALFPPYLLLLGLWLGRQLVRLGQGHALPIGKSLVIATTAATWYLGIVYWQSDLAFTALNVLPHGVPYAVLIWTHTRQEGRARGPAALLLRAGPLAAAAVALLLAFGEEWLWDLGIWHDHPGLFGPGLSLGSRAQALLVPLFALPQAVHYVLDGLLWRRPVGSTQ